MGRLGLITPPHTMYGGVLLSMIPTSFQYLENELMECIVRLRIFWTSNIFVIIVFPYTHDTGAVTGTKSGVEFYTLLLIKINIAAFQPFNTALFTQLLRIKVTPDLHLTYSKNGGNLGLVLKMKNIACISILLTKHVKYTYLYLFKFVLYSIVAFKAN